MGVLARELRGMTMEVLAFDGTRLRASNRRRGSRTPLATVVVASGMIVARVVLPESIGAMARIHETLGILSASRRIT
jgi:hypothetical protein